MDKTTIIVKPSSEFCPNCGIGIDHQQAKQCHCNNCGADWNNTLSKELVDRIKSKMGKSWEGFKESAEHENYSHKEIYECGYIAAIRQMNNILNLRRKNNLA